MASTWNAGERMTPRICRGVSTAAREDPDGPGLTQPVLFVVSAIMQVITSWLFQCRCPSNSSRFTGIRLNAGYAAGSFNSFYLHLVVILIAGILFSCKTAEKIHRETLRPMSAVRLFRKAEENSFTYNHFAVKRINIQYDNGETKTSFRAGLMAIRDSSLLLSISKLNIPLAKVLLTPDSVLYVNYFEKSYYAGNYEPIGQMTGMDLHFNLVQALLSANIFSLFEKPKEMRAYTTWVEEGMYVLQPEDQRKIALLEEKGKEQRADRIGRRLEEEDPVVRTYFFDPDLFVIRKMTLENKSVSEGAEITFNDYEKVGGTYYPASVDLNVSTAKGTVTVTSRMSGFSTDDGEFVPLKVPEKFQRVYLN